MVKVSIIVPVFNQEKYLPRCLDSLINQTLYDIEIICVNDGSTDRSSEILKQYQLKDKRIKTIDQKNGGLSSARNTGLKYASGEFVGFVDSDDWVDVEYYEYLVGLIETHNADVAMASMRTVSCGKFSEATTEDALVTNIDDKIHKLSNGSVCDKLFRRNIFVKHALQFPQGRYYEDNIVLIKAIYFSKSFVITNYVSYYYFINNRGICRTPNEKIVKKRTDDKFVIAKAIMDFAKKYHFEKSEELKKFILRTVANDFLLKKSLYYSAVCELLGAGYIKKIKFTNFINKIIRFFYTKDSKIRILRIPVKKTATRRKHRDICIVGKFTYYGEGCNAFNKLSHIGSYCSIGKNVQFGTSQHFVNTLTTSPIVNPYHNFLGFPKSTNLDWKKYHDDFFDANPLIHQKPVSVGNDCWIGNNVIIMDGIRIGHGAIIGSGAVVTHDVPPYAIVAGVPARIVKYRFEKKVIEDLLYLKWWNLPTDTISGLPFHDITTCIKILKKVN